MVREGEFTQEMSAVKFRDDFFLHSIANQNPRLYHELYDEPDVPEEWDVPQSQEDLQALMAELAAVGVNVNVED
jgi:hypothetical protein